MSNERLIATMLRSLVKSGVEAVSATVNLKKSAIDDTVERLMPTAAVDYDGNLTFRIGQTNLYSTLGDGITPATLLERVQELKTSAPHLFDEDVSNMPGARSAPMTDAEFFSTTPEQKLALEGERSKHNPANRH